MIDLKNLDLNKLLSKFRMHPERLGIAVGSRAVRVVRLVKAGNEALRLAGFGSLDMNFFHMNLAEQQNFRNLIAEIGGGVSRVAINIEHPTLRIRRMNFPPMPDDDLLEAIKWSFKDHVEIPMDNYEVGYTPIGGVYDGNKKAMMAYGVSRDAVNEIADYVKEQNLKAVSIEPTATALLAAFYASGVLSDSNYHVCVLFEEDVSLFVVMKGRDMLFSRPLSGVNNGVFVKLVMRNLNLEEDEARKALSSWSGRDRASTEKTGEAAAGGGLEPIMQQIEMTVGHFMSQFVMEVQRSIDAFCVMYAVDHIDQIHVCGLCAHYPSMIERMARSLGIKTQECNPFAGLMEKEQQTPEILKDSPLYAVAVGLAVP